VSFEFRRILCPIDFDESADAVLAMAAKIALANDGTVYVLHVVPMVVAPTGMPVYVDIYKGQEEVARTRLQQLGRKHLSGLKYELLTNVGAPIGTILRAEKQIPADLVVMATHGRRGFAHVFLGSIAEAVVRESVCPVLTVRTKAADSHVVEHWMSTNPVTARPDEKLANVEKYMHDGKFRSIPVVKDGRVIGIISDRDIRLRAGRLEDTRIDAAMSTNVLSVTPRTSVWDAARLLSERKIGGVPVLDDKGGLVGMLTASDLLRALYEMQE
jgi:CBS domain-containing protein